MKTLLVILAALGLSACAGGSDAIPRYFPYNSGIYYLEANTYCETAPSIPDRYYCTMRSQPPPECSSATVYNIIYIAMDGSEGTVNGQAATITATANSRDVTINGQTINFGNKYPFRYWVLTYAPGCEVAYNREPPH